MYSMDALHAHMQIRHEIRMAEKFSSCTKNDVFFHSWQLRKKDTIFGAARKIFGPSYFVTALVHQ